MKQLRSTLIVSCVLIVLGIVIVLQSDYVKSTFRPEAITNFIEEDGVTPAIAAPYPALPESQAGTGQTDLIAAEYVESSMTITRKTGFVISRDQEQTASKVEVSTKTQLKGEGTIDAGDDENPVIDQRIKKFVTGKTDMQGLPSGNHDADDSTEALSETPITFVPVRMTAPLREAEASDGLENGAREDPVTFIWPAEEKWLSGYNFSYAHPGIDIAAKSDDLIFAAASGKVSEVQHSYYGYGNIVIIDHLNGYQTLYAHLNTILVNMGDFVIQGQPIGLAGSTGYSTGTHLHFEIHDQGRFVNPWLFLTR